MIPIPLARSFYKPSAAAVAARLLGHWLVRKTPDGPCGGPIVETEAYLTGDPACHAFGGETARNRVMWGPPGRAYVYLIYGYHFCVNAVCQPAGIAEAVLIRAIEPAAGKELMLRNRPLRHARDLTNGPAKLCAALEIDRELDGIDLCELESPLMIASNPDFTAFRQAHGPIVTAPRIGITRAAELPLRFYLKGNPWVSKRVREERT